MVWEYIYRTVFIYFLVLAVIRMMGKREIGQLSPFDFVVAIIIAELAAMPMEMSNIPLWHSVLPLVILGVLEVAVSYATLLSQTLRGVVCGHPQVVIKNGKLLREEMRKARYNLDDLMAQLREKGVVDPSDVEFAVLETSGKLSVILKSQRRPVTPADLGISTPYEGLPTVLVMDGNVMKKNLKEANLDEKWLLQALQERQLSPKKILLATLSTDGRLYISEK
ncbi:predicted membrane protein [Pelotomaculum thermopropionicum SI]|uniref:Predicted membrane protein n=1 Tax=Pelotomaculum thermopropionicum (strain DSM 13744 / JCM 10971 / SI) TaxID=370438 RepID=A5D3Y7_PELTS|nr:predicted membrane protein [Pelotomaculum thermopropionicum SI]